MSNAMKKHSELLLPKTLSSITKTTIDVVVEEAKIDKEEAIKIIETIEIIIRITEDVVEEITRTICIVDRIIERQRKIQLSTTATQISSTKKQSQSKTKEKTIDSKVLKKWTNKKGTAQRRMKILK